MIWRRNFIRAPYRTAAGSLFDCCQISRRYRYGPSTTNDLLLPLFFFSLFLSGVVLYNIEKKKKNIDEKGRHPAQASNKKGLLRSMAIGDIHDRIYTVLPSYTSLSLYEAVKYRYMYVYILQDII
jgi:hypothetical protein